MTWAKLMDVINLEGSEEEKKIMQPKEFTISELSELFGVSQIRIYQLQKRKHDPLPLTKAEGKTGRNVLSIKEIPLLSWIEHEENVADPRKKIDFSQVHQVLNQIFENRDQIIEKYMAKIQE